MRFVAWDDYLVGVCATWVLLPLIIVWVAEYAFMCHMISWLWDLTSLCVHFCIVDVWQGWHANTSNVIAKFLILNLLVSCIEYMLAWLTWVTWHNISKLSCTIHCVISFMGKLLCHAFVHWYAYHHCYMGMSQLSCCMLPSYILAFHLYRDLQLYEYTNTWARCLALSHVVV